MKDPQAVASIELRIARILVIGMRVAMATMSLGVVLLLAGGRSPLDGTWPALDLPRLPADLIALKPEAFLWSGLLVVLATPVLRVVASTIGFAASGERRMVILGLLVLGVVGVAIIAGVAGG